MKKINLFIFSFLLVGFALTLNRCDCEFFNDDDLISSKTGIVVGAVSELGQSGLADVEVYSGNQTTYSTNDGTFILQNIPIGDRVSINFRINGYAPTSKIARVIENDTSYIQTSMSKWAVSSSINSSQNNTVQFQNASVKLPPNSLVDENGNAVSGNVDVKASYFDPTDSLYSEVFPGDFTGENTSGNTVPIESFGFINVEISQGGKELDLAPGQESEITIPLPSALQSTAPATIPLWYFDEVIGIWIEDGSATKINGKYVGTVSHFTSWNADVGIDASCQIKGKVVCDDGTPVPDAKVFVNGIDYVSTSSTTTANDGTYDLLVKPDSRIRVYAKLFGPTGLTLYRSQDEYANTGSLGSTTNIEDLIFNCGDTSSNNSFSFIYDVYSVDNGLAWSVGENGRIFYYNKDETNDLWTLIPSTTTQALYAIDCPSFDNFWVVGSNGTVLQSTNFGQNWNAVAIGTDADLHDVEFIFKYGWIAGSTGKFFRTTNGGNNWNQVNTGTVQTIYDISFINKDEGWLCGSSSGGNGLIMHTNDGGQNWTSQNSLVQENLKGIKFTTTLKGWAVGDNGTIIRTIDGGQTWTTQNSGTLEDLNAIDIFDMENAEGYIVGNNGVVKKTEDGGDSWINGFLSYYPQNSMYAVDISSGGVAWLGGDGEIFWALASPQYPRPNGWTKQNAGTTSNISDVLALSESEVWMVGDNGLVINSIDKGANWDIKTGFQRKLFCIENQGNNLWIGGSNGAFWKSEDMGQNWNKINSFPNDMSILKIDFSSSSRGWSLVDINNSDQSVTASNEVYHTIDGGQTWNKVTNIPGWNSGGIADVFFINENKGWIIETTLSYDEPTKVHKTVDGGNSWTTDVLYYSDIHDNASFYTIDGNYLWLMGFWAVMYNSDQDQVWYSKESESILAGRKLKFTDFETGWCLNSGGKLYKSVNSGRTWRIHDLEGTVLGYEVFGLDMFNNDVGWAAGKYGAIYYTNTGGE